MGDIATIYAEGLIKANERITLLEAELGVWRGRANFAVGVARHENRKMSDCIDAWWADYYPLPEGATPTARNLDPEPDINEEKAHRDWLSRNHGGDDPREER